MSKRIKLLRSHPSEETRIVIQLKPGGHGIIQFKVLWMDERFRGYCFSDPNITEFHSICSLSYPAIEDTSEGTIIYLQGSIRERDNEGTVFHHFVEKTEEETISIVLQALKIWAREAPSWRKPKMFQRPPPEAKTLTEEGIWIIKGKRPKPLKALELGASPRPRTYITV